MKREQFELIKPEERQDIREYKGFTCATNNLLRTFKVHRKKRLIEFNSFFLKNSPSAQAHFLFEWCTRAAKSNKGRRIIYPNMNKRLKREAIEANNKDRINDADLKTIKWAIREGYTENEILPLYMAKGVFHSKEHAQVRAAYMISKKVTLIDKFILWIGNTTKKIFQTGK